MPRHKGQNSTGGTRPDFTGYLDRYPLAIGRVIGQAELLRALLSKRLDPDEREMAASMLRRAEREPLSDRQLAWTERTAKAYGAVYEAPAEQPVPPGCVSVQPWGRLPAKPPRRVTG